MTASLISKLFLLRGAAPGSAGGFAFLPVYGGISTPNVVPGNSVTHLMCSCAVILSKAKE